jgi:hypothetical protein
VSSAGRYTGGDQGTERARPAAPALSAADQASVLAAARERPLLRALVALAVVGLAFAIVAALGTLR